MTLVEVWPLFSRPAKSSTGKNNGHIFFATLINFPTRTILAPGVGRFSSGIGPADSCDRLHRIPDTPCASSAIIRCGWTRAEVSWLAISLTTDFLIAAPSTSLHYSWHSNLSVPTLTVTRMPTENAYIAPLVWRMLPDGQLNLLAIITSSGNSEASIILSDLYPSFPSRQRTALSCDEASSASAARSFKPFYELRTWR